MVHYPDSNNLYGHRLLTEPAKFSIITYAAASSSFRVPKKVYFPRSGSRSPRTLFIADFVTDTQ